MARELKPIGLYSGQIKNWYRGLTQNGKPFVEFVIWVNVFKDEDGKETELEEPFSVFVTKYLSRESLPYALKDLVYLGFTDKDLSKLDRDHPEAFNFKDKAVWVRNKHEEYNGTERDKWELYRQRFATPEQRKKIDSELSEDFAREMAIALGEEPQDTEDPFATGSLAGAGRF